MMIYCSCALYQHYSDADYTRTYVPCLNSARPLSLSHWHFCRANFQSHKVTVSPSLCPHAHTSSFYISFVPRTIHNWNLHMYSHLPLYHPINLIFGHKCEISYCTAIIIVSLAISVKFFHRSRTQF